jgi:hypothetical protein
VLITWRTYEILRWRATKTPAFNTMNGNSSLKTTEFFKLVSSEGNKISISRFLSFLQFYITQWCIIATDVIFWIKTNHKYAWRRADHLSRGVLPSMVCVWVWSWSIDDEEALAHWGLLRQGEKNIRRNCAVNIVYKSTITNMAILRNFEATACMMNVTRTTCLFK